jgi:hypothetical protein
MAFAEKYDSALDQAYMILFDTIDTLILNFRLPKNVNTFTKNIFVKIIF